MTGEGLMLSCGAWVQVMTSAAPRSWRLRWRQCTWSETGWRLWPSGCTASAQGAARSWPGWRSSDSSSGRSWSTRRLSMVSHIKITWPVCQHEGDNGRNAAERQRTKHPQNWNKARAHQLDIQFTDLVWHFQKLIICFIAENHHHSLYKA